MPTDSFGRNMSEDKLFVKDIRLMMYGLGDSAFPLIETAELLEKIILRQLMSIIAQAKNIASMRNGENVAPEDLLFLMRKNLVGLKRLIAYLAFKDEKQILNKVMSDDNVVTPDDMLISEESRPVSWKSCRKNYCLSHLRKIGIDESQLASVEDLIKKERQNRADSLSKKLTPRDYKSYHEARRASFGSSPKKFLLWLERGGLTMDLNSSVIEILVYLAKETLSQIMDMVLTLREQRSNSQFTGETPAVSPKEVQEVVRICWTPQSFTLGILSRDIPAYCHQRLLAI